MQGPFCFRPRHTHSPELGVPPGLIQFAAAPPAFGRSHRPFYSWCPMTEVSRIADSAAFKVAVPILQAVLSAAAVGAFTYVVSSLGSLQVQLATYQTNQALIGQRVESLERARESTDKFVDSLRINSQRQEFQINQVGESLRDLVKNGRPK